ncbi:hypothetical protein Tco_1053874 [Tanacetum coccineum]|uniref:Uncharacterized protein n=1 Tax=Tanacetum coccineum TaxID=301880 RepID=A0ABQ5GV60_9ASTR
MWEKTRFIKLEVVRRSGFPVWLEYVTGITFTIDNEPFKAKKVIVARITDVVLFSWAVSNKATEKALIFEDEATYNQSLMPPNDDFVNDVHQQISCIPGDHMIAEHADTDHRSNNRDSQATTTRLRSSTPEPPSAYIHLRRYTQMNDAGMVTLY